MSSSHANQCRSPVITLEIIYRTALGHWTDTYSEDTPPTRIRIDNFDEIFRFMNRVHTNQAYADRVRSIGVTFVDSEAFTRVFGLLIVTVLPALRNINELLLEGCISNDPGIHSSPLLCSSVLFQRLTNLTCDIPPSPQFERFLAVNPTITDLFCSGSVDIYSYVIGTGRILPLGILPNLAVVKCDAILMSYYIQHRPVVEVIPRNVMFLGKQGMHAELTSLSLSTAGGGIQVGEGVQIFHLGLNYPLECLARVAPNLLRLIVYDEETCPPDFFWTTPGWEQNIMSFKSLQEIYVQSESPFTEGEQSSLVTCWSAGHLTLAHVTFESNVPTAGQQMSSPARSHGPDDEQTLNLPALVHGGPDNDSGSVSEDESDHSDGLDERMSDHQVTTIISRWIRDSGVERWSLVRD